MVYNYEVFADWLREKMEARDLTQAAVAGSVGVTQQTVSKWLNKTHPQHPNSRHVPPLATVLGVTAAEVLSAIDDSVTQSELSETRDEDQAALHQRLDELEAEIRRLRQRAGGEE